jgi:glycerate 2-kinase
LIRRKHAIFTNPIHSHLHSTTLSVKILVCPDKFKDSLSAAEVCAAIKTGIESVEKVHEIMTSPMADGGEGSLEIIKHYLRIQIRMISTIDPLGRNIHAPLAICEEKAFIDTSLIIGLQLLAPEERNPMHTGTYGLGAMIKEAIHAGCKEIHIFTGGSATNDGGTGMASALGYRFISDEGAVTKLSGKTLNEISCIIPPAVHPIPVDVRCICYTDVRHVMYGIQGAALNFSVQKGADLYESLILDKGLKQLAGIFLRDLKVKVGQTPGGGAAGALAAGCKAFLNADIRSGMEFFRELTQLDESIKSADLIITGEGKSDHQSLKGKVVSGVAAICRKYHKPMILVVGQNRLSVKELKQLHCHKMYTLQKKGVPVSHSMIHAKNLLYETGRNIILNMAKR